MKPKKSEKPSNQNKRRAAGIREYALVQVDEVLLHWADEIVCMEMWMVEELTKQTEKTITCLDIPDEFEYRDARLMELVKERYLDQ